jgi:Tfp pilus assembly protein FimV
VRRLRRPRCVTYTLSLLLLAPVKIFALELGEASIKNALGESLLVEIPYRLAANERLTPACVKLAPARSRDALPTYTRADRITIGSTAIEIFDNARVREPLIGLTIDIDCDTALHFVRTYELLVDLPAQAPAISFASTPRQSAAADQVASAPVAKAVRVNASRRARGHAGGNVTQGQTYRVVRGDTLSGLAARIADRPATIRETSDAIFAANPNAFTHGNRDLIEEGRSIVIPILARATATAGTRWAGGCHAQNFTACREFSTHR